MDAKTRLILSFVMTAAMVFMVTLIVTLLNLGLHAGFAWQWLKAYLIAWPIAGITAFFVMVPARRLTDRIVALIEGKP
jgi:uncharacterized membrane protein YjgN (DUF898 family)